MARITVCVPVYNAADFVGETLESIASQSERDLHVLISIDESRDGSEDICREFCSDSRFEVVRHPERQGWVKNCNFLISQVESELFALIPHDDLLQPSYFEVLLDALQENEDAVCAYSDIAIFGARDGKVRQPSIRGDRFRRILDFFLNQRASVAFRGLVRRQDADDRPYLLEDIPKDYAADMIWLLQLALRGELIRVPKRLYRKRMHDGNTHQTWTTWPREEQAFAWIHQCATCTKLALAEEDDPDRRSLILFAAVLRLFGSSPSGAVVTMPDRALERAALAARFGAMIGPVDWPLNSQALVNSALGAPLRAAARANAGEAALREGDAKAAVAALEEALQLDPLSEQAAIQLGNAKEALKDV